MVVNIFKKRASWLVTQQRTILSAAFVIMLSTASSLVLGLLRQRLLAAYFGQSVDVLEAYIAAARIPEVVFEVIIFSAVSVAFIPVFSQLMAEKKSDQAWRFTANVLNWTMVIFFILAILIFATAPILSVLIAPGKGSATQQLVSRLIQVMIIPQFFFALSVFLTGILQASQRFIFPALAAIFYNLGIILGIVFLSPMWGIFGPAWGMVIGAVCHFGLQLPLAYHLGLRFKMVLDWRERFTLQMVHLTTPRMIGLAVGRLGDLVNIALASLISTGSVVAFNFSQILYFFPINLIGASMAQAALPTLSFEHSRKKEEDFKTTLLTTLHQLLYLVLPAAAILAVLRIPMVRLAFGAAQFPWDLTVLTGRTLIVFTIGLPAQAASLLLIRAFYAMHDVKTPVLVNLVGAATNILLSVVFVKVLHLSVLYLAAAYAIANVANSLLLLFFLDLRLNFNKQQLFVPAAKIALSSLLMAVALYLPMKLLDQLVIDTTRTVGLLLITTIATFCGLIVYLILTWIFKVGEVRLLMALLRKMRLFKTDQVVVEDNKSLFSS